MRTSGCSRAQQGWQHAGRVKCDECAIILLYCVVSGRVALFNGISHINLRSPTNRPTNRESAAPKSTAAAALSLSLAQSTSSASQLREQPVGFAQSGESFGILPSARHVGIDSG